MTLAALTPREASIFACLCDTVVGARAAAAAGAARPTAVAFFDTWLARSPRLNRIALRGLLYARRAGAARARRAGAAAAPGRRGASAGARGGRGRAARRRPGSSLKLVKGMAFLSYYADDGVMLRLGYDADANVRRARELRAREARP